MFDSDVLIIGAGPAGLAAAIAARAKGLTVIVTEASSPGAASAAGEELMPRAVADLGALGMALPPELGASFRGIRLIDQGIQSEAIFRHGAGRGIRRDELLSVLVERAQFHGVEILWNLPVVDLDHGVAVTREGGIESRFVIGADGEASQVRRWAGLDPLRGVRHRHAFRQSFSIAPWTDLFEIHFADGVQALVTPVGPDEVSVTTVSESQDLRFGEALEFFPDLQERLGAPPPGNPRGMLSASRRLVDVERGNVALIGDAAGSVDLLSGEGLTLAFEQAIVLAEALARGDLEGIRGEYARIRRPAAFAARLLLLASGHARIREFVMRQVGVLALLTSASSTSAWSRSSRPSPG